MITKNNVDFLLENFGLSAEEYEVMPHGGGLIHQTYLVKSDDTPKYILQKVNTSVFKQPEAIAENIHFLGEYLHTTNPNFPFTVPIATLNDANYARLGEDYYRLFPFVTGSHTISTCTTADQAYEAAKAFGTFTFMLSDCPIEQLQITLPNFHQLSLRFDAFLVALKAGNPHRLVATKPIVDWFFQHQNVVEKYKAITVDKYFKLRVTHHDTKISNVLFDNEQKSICVIDLDTVMPGYFISDVGDMIRTYTSAADEEEIDLEKISVRKSFLDAIKEGYLENMQDRLSKSELSDFNFSGQFMIYMQALRFFTDYINDDMYYGAKYPDHNLMRAKNQIKLFECLIAL
jgi:Ser/Thr protein kinase RdoA (MazF antagonist)